MKLSKNKRGNFGLILQHYLQEKKFIIISNLGRLRQEDCEFKEFCCDEIQRTRDRVDVHVRFQRVFLSEWI